MTFKLSQRSLSNLDGVHPDLVDVVKLAIQRTPIDFMVIEGMRSHARQKKLFQSGASKTMNSRHLTGHAVDIVPLDDGQVSWDWPLYHRMAPAIKQAATDLDVDLEWGGDWTSFKDGPHWQLPWSEYGKDDMRPRAKSATAAPKPAAPVQATPDTTAALKAEIAAILEKY